MYSITRAGREALRAWMAEPPGPDRTRNELLLKVFLGPAVDPALLLEHVVRYEDHQRDLARQYEGFEAQIEELASSPEEMRLWKLTLSSGQHVNRARLRWCREAKLALEELARKRAELRR